MEQRRCYLNIFFYSFIPFFLGIIFQRIMISLITVTSVVGIVLIIQIKRKCLLDWKWREWLGRKDYPVIYWLVIGIEAFAFAESLMFLKNSIAIINQ
jgi:hypothetical protein